MTDLVTPFDSTTYRYPDEHGRFGPYGGRFVPETLMPALEELEEAYLQARNDAFFRVELDRLLRTYCLLYTSPSPRDRTRSRMPSSA